MKRIGRKWWLQALAVAIISLTVACSVDDADVYDAVPSHNSVVATTGIYEGEWTVNKQVVDTARLVVTDNVIQVRLPEKYLVSTYLLPFYNSVFFGNIGDKNGKGGVNEGVPIGGVVSYEFHDTPVTAQVSAQGYSEQSQYMSFMSSTMLDGSLLTRFNAFSFEMAVNSMPFHIDLLSREYATAVIQNATGQWTLGIPIDGFLVKDLTTGESMVHEVSGTIIYYNTKRRIR